MSKKIEERYINPIAYLSSYVQILKITVMALVIILLILSFSIYKLSAKQQIVVGLDQNNMPVPMEIKSEEIGNLINYKQFISYFLVTLYSWDNNTYISTIRSVVPMMADTTKDQYLKILQEKKYLDVFKEQKITSVIKIIRIKEDTIIKYKSGFQIKVEATKIRLVDFIEREQIVEFTIGFRPCRPSQDNIWGLEIFELYERLL